ncbi:hypothetical protein PYCCODRAFT_1429265 [Trametes coccinea BRFM310]|uniref:Uncharacterized protein n=1 Tax=Trametes coccinea (strain BRFM310) TaxID=1353009 RepID=A0A1Y2I4U2_TRAC3|nr:hypothetical protein PYCCODRAFT_1429265 [Trametes coccinea BRFM310]
MLQRTRTWRIQKYGFMVAKGLGLKRRLLRTTRTCTQIPAAPSPPRSRSGRHIRVPKYLKDFIPLIQDELPAHLVDAFPDPAPRLSPSPQPYRSPTVEDCPEEEDLFETSPCLFGTFCRYTVAPQRDPEAHKSLESVSDTPLLSKTSSEQAPRLAVPSSISWLGRHAERHADGDDEGSSYGGSTDHSDLKLFGGGGGEGEDSNNTQCTCNV